MKRLLIVLLLITFLPLSVNSEDINPDINFDVGETTGLEIDNPKTVSRISMDFSQPGVLSVSPSGVGNIKLRLYSYPREDYSTQVLNLNPTPAAEEIIEDGEEYLLFEWENAENGDLEYAVEAEIVSDLRFRQIREPIPFPYSVPEGFQMYTKPTKRIESDSSEVKKIANQLAEGETDAYVIAHKLSAYSQKNIEYDLNLVGELRETTEILEHKTGVCVEYSNLFIALARSLGMPARYVSGYAFGGVYGTRFAPHAWAEVWYPEIGWVPYDPTFGEHGWVDATHVGSQVSEGVETTSISYEWVGGRIDAKLPISEFEVTDVDENLPNLIETELWMQEDETGFDSYNIIWMKLTNPNDFYISTEAYLTKAPVLLTGNQQSVLLEPQDSATVAWIVDLADDLENQYIYTLEIEANALFGETQARGFKYSPRSETSITLEEVEEMARSVEAEDSPKGSPKISLKVLHPERTYVGDKYDLVANVKNSGTTSVPDLKICLKGNQESCQTKYTGINDEIELVFEGWGRQEGVAEYTVTVSGSGIADTSQNVGVVVQKKPFFRSIIDKIKGLFGLN